jgi:hypothetical protein
MPIVEIKSVRRPNTGVEFFNLTTNPALEQAKAAMGYSITEVENTGTYSKRVNADNSMIVERALSDDGLVQKTTVTFSDLATYSHVDSCLGIALDVAFRTYTEAGNFVPHDPADGPQYVQSGINQAFNCTTVYHYTSRTAELYPLFDSFVSVIEATNKLVSLVNNGSSVTAVHQYLNSEDFTENHWDDFQFITKLHNAGVTRTITYELV